MMSARADSGKKIGGGGDGRLLQEIEALGRALYVNKNAPKTLISAAVPAAAAASDNRSKSVGKSHFSEPKLNPRFVKEESSHKDKKSSIWNWKPLKALSHIRNRRFNCCFSLQVHSIEGLTPEFDNVSMCVHWRRRDVGLQTRPSKGFNGRAEFEEVLTHRCSVYGSGNGPHHSAKYEAKYFLLYALVVGAADIDLGKHRIDMTRLLPLTLEELEEDKSTGKWTTSFKLSGKAKGAILNVSFGFLITGDDSVESRTSRNATVSSNLKQSKQSIARPTMGFDTRGTLQRSGSLASIPKQRSHPPFRSVDDVKILHEVLPSSKSELSSSVSFLYQKLDEGKKLNEQKMDSFADSKPEFEVFSGDSELLKARTSTVPETGKENLETECEDTEFSVVEQGIEVPATELIKVEETAAEADDVPAEETTVLDEFSKDDATNHAPPDAQDDFPASCVEELSADASNSKELQYVDDESAVVELENAFENFSIFDSVGSGNQQVENDFLGQSKDAETESNYNPSKLGRSLSFDDVTSSVASEFLNMLGIEHSPFGMSSDSDPESPRERLLRQFEKDALASGSSLFGFGIGDMDAGYPNDSTTYSESGGAFEDFELSSVVQAAEAEHKKLSQFMESKTRAKMLENLETEELMREWGLNEKAFQSSPPNSADGFGSPIALPLPEPSELPSLGDGFGPYIQTKDGGFLRSMNPSLFRNAKNCGSLVMQVSSPVVVPADMGSGIMDILQHLASVGIEKLSMQAKKLMPLEDITGKTMQQVAWEALPCLETPQRQSVQLELGGAMQDALSWGKKSNGGSSGHKSDNSGSRLSKGEMGSEFDSLEDLAPLAMDKIEALAMEGLRIQSGMSDEEAPSNISSQAVGEISTFEGRKTCLGMEGAGSMQLLDIKDGGNDVDGLMGLSITLDEWMRLDAGIMDDDEEISERTSKILAAHHANSLDMICGETRRDRKRGKGSGRKCGLLGNNFTVALMVQLRDPLRNYEPVGTPMLSLIQVERVFVPPKPKIYCTVSERRSSEEDEEFEFLPKDRKEETKENKEEEEPIPQFKITEVHVAGLKPEPGKSKLWGTAKQQQSGSRWLLATGMGKNNKHPFMKSKSTVKSSPSPQATTTVQPGETLWSISARVHGNGAKWKELAALNPHIRNPNVIFPNETIRLK
ncbi:hypothetical protein Sjap_009947 [Stephania japonica]|uniref:Protein PLASTID MOVEMENT IMPAIRED 1-RELATED 1 n=1 Tax=Stephania japonica TaxID=461633 RepID=A0AAP0P5Y1_9MAGN